MVPRLDTHHLANTQRIQRMRLLDTKPGAVPTRPPARPGANRQPQRAQLLDETVAGCIDGGGVHKPRFRLFCYLRMAELLRCLVAFGLIALVAGQAEIGCPIGASSAFGPDMVQFKGDITLLTIDTAIVILD